MPSSTSNSEKRYLIAAALTFVVLVGAWEVVLRMNAGATVEFALKRPQLAQNKTSGENWIVFGNCLVMTGISPKALSDQLGSDRERVILNIAAHEQSPIAFFNYLRRSRQYPTAVILNVSSWINGTNFEQESELVAQLDPLGIGTTRASAEGERPTQAYRSESNVEGGLQKRAEAALAGALGTALQSVAHRYHLFDYALFLGTLATTADLRNALYQLNIQSWFKVTSSETDGLGFLGVHVNYREDWPAGVDQMAERYLKRMRFSRLLTTRYWSLLEEAVHDFQQHGTRVYVVRMPEHPAIREFNNATYDLPTQLRRLEDRTRAFVLDLSALGPADGVRLFDAVHPDAEAAAVITRRLADWLRSQPRPAH